jgi:hypothetical protein
MTITMTPLAERLMAEFPQDFQEGADAQDKIEQGMDGGERAKAIWAFVEENTEDALSPKDFAFWIGQGYGTI